jgi:hypothetical protein
MVLQSLSGVEWGVLTRIATPIFSMGLQFVLEPYMPFRKELGGASFEGAHIRLNISKDMSSIPKISFMSPYLISVSV